MRVIGIALLIGAGLLAVMLLVQVALEMMGPRRRR